METGEQVRRSQKNSCSQRHTQCASYRRMEKGAAAGTRSTASAIQFQIMARMSEKRDGDEDRNPSV